SVDAGGVEAQAGGQERVLAGSAADVEYATAKLTGVGKCLERGLRPADVPRRRSRVGLVEATSLASLIAEPRRLFLRVLVSSHGVGVYPPPARTHRVGSLAMRLRGLLRSRQPGGAGSPARVDRPGRGRDLGRPGRPKGQRVRRAAPVAPDESSGSPGSSPSGAAKGFVPTM